MEESRLKYLLKNITNVTIEEREELNRWYNSFEEKPFDSHLEELYKNPDQIGNKIHKNIQDKIKENTITRKLSIYKIAASIALILSIGAMVFWLVQQPLARQNYLTASTGEQKHILMEDGTEIWLNSQSEINYSDHFEDERVVHLAGEAYFKVAKDPSRPFKVISGDLTTTVLGTEFNIQAYDLTKPISVALVEGSVKLSNGNIETALKPGTKALYSSNSEEFQLAKFDLTEESGWLNNQLTYNATPLREIAISLYRKYGIQIKFAKEEYADYEFTGKFKDEELSIILTSIVRAHGLKFQTIDNQIIEFYK